MEEVLLAALAQLFPDLTLAELSAALQEATGGADWNAKANSRHMKSETGWRLRDRRTMHLRRSSCKCVKAFMKPPP